jgi:Rrf2 family protein
MQIALERKGDYTVRAVLDLARHHGAGRRKAREIASAMDLPMRYVPQLLAPLVRRGVLTAVAGPDGGYALARDPASVSLLEVIEAAEGPIESPHCVLRGGPCEWGEICPVHEPWGRALRALAVEFERTTFADLDAVDAAIQSGAIRSQSPLHLEPVERRGVRDAQPKRPRRGRSRLAGAPQS